MRQGEGQLLVRGVRRVGALLRLGGGGSGGGVRWFLGGELKLGQFPLGFRELLLVSQDLHRPVDLAQQRSLAVTRNYLGDARMPVSG